MAALLGMFFAKLLGIAGVGGLISGLFIRKWPLAFASGITFGLLSTIVLASIRLTGVGTISWMMGIFVGILMATIGWWVRGRKLGV